MFWSEGDYFEAGHTKPLLHTWSLAVEEQFYLFFGLAVIIFRFAPKLFLPVLAILTVASLGLSHYVEPRSPKTVFFLLPSRMWQLALGIFAMYIGQKIGRRGASINHILVLVCFATILVCGIVFDKTATFPGWQAYIACLATAIALIALDVQTRSLPILSFSPFSYIGKLSCGFYLWHWPAITLWFLGTQSFPSPATAFVLMLFSFGAAAASYHFVEVPIRKRQFLQNGRALRQFVLGGMATTFAVASSF